MIDVAIALDYSYCLVILTQSWWLHLNEWTMLGQINMDSHIVTFNLTEKSGERAGTFVYTHVHEWTLTYSSS